LSAVLFKIFTHLFQSSKRVKEAIDKVLGKSPVKGTQQNTRKVPNIKKPVKEDEVPQKKVPNKRKSEELSEKSSPKKKKVEKVDSQETSVQPEEVLPTETETEILENEASPDLEPTDAGQNEDFKPEAKAVSVGKGRLFFSSNFFCSCYAERTNFLD